MQSHQAGDLVGAAPHYRSALAEHEPLRSHPAVLTNYGLAAQAEGRASEAAVSFQKVISLTPDDPNAHYNLGNALADANEHTKAAESFAECTRLSPSDAEAYYGLGLALLQGSAKSTWSSLGYAQEELGARGEAEASWRRAIDLEPSSETAAASWTNLGGLLRREDRLLEARHSYERALELAPDRAEAYLGLGRTYEPPGTRGVPSGGVPSGGVPSDALADGYVDFLAATYGVATRLAPRAADAYLAIAEGLRMYGIHGTCDALGGRSALDYYTIALALRPDDTCAATHVAFADRAPRSDGTADDGAADDGAADDDDDGAADDDGALPADVRASCSSAPVADTVEGLMVSSAPGDAGFTAEARRLWDAHGLVVFPRLLSASRTARLLDAVRAAQHGNRTRDYTRVTRDKAHRTHKALDVREAHDALDEIGRALAPFLAAALGVEDAPESAKSPSSAPQSAPVLLESGFMVTAPGASAQLFHRDVAPSVVSASSLAVSIQISLVDTHATQGALEVIPGSHTFDASATERERQQSLPHVPVAVPAGSVTVYALHTMHRGAANTAGADRPFYFFTLAGDGLAPPGLAYTIEHDDIGKWELATKLQPRRQRG